MRLVVSLLVGSVVLAACGESSGCDSFRPRSHDLALGTSQRVEVPVHAGRLSSVDGGQRVLLEGPIGCD